MSDAKFKVGSDVYDVPTRFRLGDAVLVRELCGIDLSDLAEADAITSMTAFLAVAIWQAHPKWSRDKVIRYVEALDLEHVDAEGGDDEDPPAVGAETSGATSPERSADSTSGLEPTAAAQD